MGWLQKIPQTATPTNFYNIGLNKTILIVGLGNPGKEYNLTRHNVGFMCLDYFVSNNQSLSDWLIRKNFKASFSQGNINGIKVIAIKPTTFMNLSGEAVHQVSHFYQILPENILVIHDDLDVNFGQIRLRTGGTSAGHNGIKSISKVIGENYNRVRIGIGPKQELATTEDFVLAKFTPEEQKQLTNLKTEINSIISEYLYGGKLNSETRSFLI